MTASYETLTTRLDGTVLSATFHAPPINLIGPEVVRDLVGLLEELSRPDGCTAWWSSTARIPTSSSRTST